MSNVTTAIADNKLISGKIDTADLAGAIGRINSPLLDLDLQNSLNMKAGTGSVNFSRATTATYIDGYGVLQYADVDEPRFEKDGLLIEGSSTNHLLYASDFANWGTANGTMNSGTTPDGMTNNCYYIADTTTNEHRVYSGYEGISAVSGDTLTASFFYKNNSDAVHDQIRCRIFSYKGFMGDVVINMSTDDVYTQSSIIDDVKFNTSLSNGWVRVSVVFTVVDATETNIKFSFMEYKDGSIAVAGDGINGNWYAYPQLEKLPFATSYIPTTTAAVTRADEFALVTSKYNFPSGDKGTVLFDFVWYGHKNTLSSIWGIYPTNDDHIVCKVEGDKLSWRNEIGNVVTMKIDSATTIEKGKKYSVAIAWDSGVGYMYINGVLDTSLSYSGKLFEENTILESDIRLGGYNPTATVNNNNGLLKAFATYDKLLTVEQINLLQGGE